MNHLTTQTQQNNSSSHQAGEKFRYSLRLLIPTYVPLVYEKPYCHDKLPNSIRLLSKPSILLLGEAQRVTQRSIRCEYVSSGTQLQRSLIITKDNGLERSLLNI